MARQRSGKTILSMNRREHRGEGIIIPFPSGDAVLHALCAQYRNTSIENTPTEKGKIPPATDDKDDR